MEPGKQRRQTASVEYNRSLAAGELGDVGDLGAEARGIGASNQNSYLLESMLNFLQRDYAYTRLELVDKDELFPELPAHLPTALGRIRLAGCAIWCRTSAGSWGWERM